MYKKKSRGLPSSTFHVYLGIDDDFSGRVHKLSKKLGSQYSTKFVIGETYVPHFTLYLFAAPVRNTQKLIKTAETLSQQVKSLTLTANPLILSYDGWLMVTIKESSVLLDLHRKALKMFNPLREGILRKKYRKQNEISKLPDKEVRSLLKYGDRHTLNLYDPHISVTEFEDLESAREAFKKYKNEFGGQEIHIKTFELVKEMHGDASGRGKVLYKKTYGQ